MEALRIEEIRDKSDLICTLAKLKKPTGKPYSYREIAQLVYPDIPENGLKQAATAISQFLCYEKDIRRRDFAPRRPKDYASATPQSEEINLFSAEASDPVATEPLPDTVMVPRSYLNELVEVMNKILAISQFNTFPMMPSDRS